ncbi:SpoVR family protein [Desulfothermobacter acidiphilus]|uniref:SpoVR family protein n=1 Tax=Desulfothermobacter acidiphilus TaxID=1938353 RepID=UPI003F8B28E3
MAVAELERVLADLISWARAEGLDFSPVRVQLCSTRSLAALGAYGVPERFSHWSWGKAYQRLLWRCRLGLSRIYELVINNDPCYVFIQERRGILEYRLILAHVLAHGDFFRHNFRFRQLPADMLQRMRGHSLRMSYFIELHGRERVEEFLEAALSLQEQVDPDSTQGECKDLLLFLQQRAPDLEEWEREVLEIVRQESLYFWPQLATKILNEGWATYWHTRLMRQLPLTWGEAVELARWQARLLSPYSHSINPYLLGLRLLEDIERRYGREKIFAVRESEDDVSLVRNYLTPGLVRALDLKLCRCRGENRELVTSEPEKVKEALLQRLIYCGSPYIRVKDGDYRGKGELYLQHIFDGRELDLSHLERALSHVYFIWRRPVHLETVLGRQRVLFCCEGKQVSRRLVTCKADRSATCQPAGQEIEK